MYHRFASWLGQIFAGEFSFFMAYAIIAVLMFFLCILANRIAGSWLLSVVERVIQKSKNTYDDIFLEKKVFQRLSLLAPAMVVSILSPFTFPEETHASLLNYIERCVSVYIIVVGGLFLSAFLEAVADIYDRRYDASVSNLKGLIQAMRIILVLVVSVLIVARVTGHSPKYLLGGLGALTAVILLIFKDTILGFVAGIQLAFNKMVRIGDWVTVPHAGADGDVIDITLTTVKVQNWDKTISFVPIYSLTTHAFTNWRGMSESGGRRIKRALNIDMNSVTFCDPELLAKLEKIHCIKPYLDEKKAHLQEHRVQKNLKEDDLLNSRRLTNLGTFRAYVAAYLRENEHIHPGMTFLVRYLPCTPKGLPLEIYVFSSDQRWAQYEAIQADILDHLLAILPEFGLCVFQDPAGRDFQRAGL